ncbi:hypothetical protein Brsp01_45310 [Brucella sp. NBRC 12950]|nr:hypothetical protein Brsp01_45310 [Brucella sp. NBRC 12950]
MPVFWSGGAAAKEKRRPGQLLRGLHFFRILFKETEFRSLAAQFYAENRSSRRPLLPQSPTLH